MGRELDFRLDRRRFQDPLFLRGPRVGDDPLDPFVLDVTDAQSITRVFEQHRPDVIIHLASLAGSAADRDASKTSAVNIDSMVSIIDAAARYGVEKVIFTSSASVYGTGHRAPITENATTDGTSAYARSKLQAEQLLRARSDSGGVPSVILRIFNVWGPGFDESLVHRLLTSTPENPVRLSGFDSFVRDYVHVTDVVEALIRCLGVTVEEPTVTLNIGSGVAMSNRALVERLGTRRKLNVTVEDGLPDYSCADISLAREILGYLPERLP